MKRFLLMMLLTLLLLGCSKVEKTVTAEEQRINIKSISNARELGGYKTMDGKRVREGVLLRTASLTDVLVKVEGYLIVSPSFSFSFNLYAAKRGEPSL